MTSARWVTRTSFAIFGLPLIVVQALAFVPKVIRSPGAEAQPAPFSILVATSDAGVSATCSDGCRWEALEAKYPGDAYRITQAGVEWGGADAVASGTGAQSAGFSIVVRITPEGVAATCEHGCAWITATASSPNDRYRLSDSGIAPVTGR